MTTSKKRSRRFRRPQVQLLVALRCEDLAGLGSAGGRERPTVLCRLPAGAAQLAAGDFRGHLEGLRKGRNGRDGRLRHGYLLWLICVSISAYPHRDVNRRKRG